MEEFIRARRAYGPKRRPDEIGRRLLENHPQFDAIRIFVTRLELNPENDRLHERAEVFEYPRDGARAP